MISLRVRYNPSDGRPGSMKALVFNIQRFSLHDGPGIRTTVFLKGCPLNCKWCSNPESITSTPEIISYPIKCVGCGKCEEVCPQQAIVIKDGKSVIAWEKCDKCLKCAGVCLNGGISLVGKEMSVEEVISEVERDAPFYTNSGGGVTFSGGEPLRQWRFVTEACKKCKERGIHTALDTTGYADWEKMEEVLQYVDLLLYDIKHLDPESHKGGQPCQNLVSSSGYSWV
jgi:pyruvate formate lyase activating enzyme